jgi:hypothetical protein
MMHCIAIARKQRNHGYGTATAWLRHGYGLAMAKLRRAARNRNLEHGQPNLPCHVTHKYGHPHAQPYTQLYARIQTHTHTHNTRQRMRTLAGYTVLPYVETLRSSDSAHSSRLSPLPSFSACFCMRSTTCIPRVLVLFSLFSEQITTVTDYTEKCVFR